jgi:hypothetical protein
MKPRSPARQALADAIERRGDLEKRLAAIDSARSRADDSYMDALSDVRHAEEAIEEARDGERQRLVDVAFGEVCVAPSIADLTFTLQKAEATAAAARAVHAAVKDEVAPVKRARDRADREVERLLAVVVMEGPSIEAVVDKFRSAVAKFVEAESLVLFLAQKGCIPDRLASAAFLREEDRRSARADPAWVRSVDKLRRDPDAPLPQ